MIVRRFNYVTNVTIFLNETAASDRVSRSQLPENDHNTLSHTESIYDDEEESYFRMKPTKKTKHQK